MKNLINYLSKKSLSLENGSRLVRDRFEIGSAKSRKSIGSNLSRYSLASLICLCMLTIGSGNVWGDELYFEGWESHNNGGATNNFGAGPKTYGDFSFAYADAAGTGSPLTGSYHAILRVAKNTTNSPSLISGALLSSDETITKVSWKCKGFSGCTLKVSYSTDGSTWTEKFSSTISTIAQDKYFTISPGITGPIYLKFIVSVSSSNKNNRDANIDNITIEGTSSGGSTPSVTPDPTSLSWGTVLQGSSQGNKTISITGANLTAGTLTISATGGYSVTPTSKSVSGTLDATTLTVTPPSTSTTGAKNGKVTISGGGLASNVEVNLSMTVNAASTVTWMNNGSEYTTTLVANGSKPDFPSNPTSCDGTSTTFYGWSTSEWSGKIDDISAKTIYTSAASMPTVSGAVTYYAVFCKGGANGSISISSDDLKSGLGSSYGSGSFTKTIGVTNYTFNTYACVQSSTFQMRAADAYIQIPTLPGPITGISSTECHNAGTGNYNGTLRFKSAQAAGNTEDYDLSTKVINATSFSWDISGSYTSGYITTSTGFRLVNLTISYGTPGSKYLTNCCTDPELAYGTASVTKTFDNGTFKNTLTNSHSVSVTYESSNTDVATVASDGTVTIQGAGNATITARFAGNSTYCADEASYTLTVNKADISPTLTYTPSSVAAGSSTSAPTVGGNPGSGGVTYAITSATPASCATIDAGTGVVTGVAVGSVTVTATVAATDNYNGGSATATVTITAASGYCISAFNSSNNGITSGFSNGGSGNEYTLNYTIPGKDGSSNWPQYWIGENEAWASFSANALFADMHFTHSDATLGLAEGATGKLHIWDDNKASGSNLWVKFEPDGYGFRWGGAGEWDQAANTKAFTVDPGNANTYWTEIVTLDGTNNTSWSYYVGLQSASGYVYSGVDNEGSDNRGVSRTRSVTTMKVSNGTAGSYKATYLNSEATGTRGKFRIWDNNISDHNFVCHFVPYYRVTYNGSGASGSTAASADVCCEGNAAARTVVAAANGFTVPTGKSFGGWASSPENAAAGVVAYAAGADVVLTSSITLYAIWTDINYTVTVNQNPSVGATTTGQTTTAHYNGTINLTTTVPSGYRFVNWTTSDGFSITNPTSATTASFTMPNKNVTVTANFQQTHTVDWYVGGSAPANKIGDDGQTTVVDHGGKISDFPATTPDGSACDKVFVGWTNTSSYEHGTSPLFNDVAGSPTINADASFYAVFAAEGGSSEPTNKFSVALNEASPSVPSGYTLSQATEWKNSTHRQDGSNDPAYIKVYHTSTKLFSSLPSTITIKAGLYGGSARDMSEDGSDYYPYVFFTDNSGNEIAGSAKAICTSVTNSSVEKSVDMDVSKATNAYGIGIRHKKISSFNLRYSSITLTYAESSYTGHTITCADCGTSVTPTYTASPTGGTVSVTKNAAAVASGSTVKTCTSQDLTVTLTPATHYDLTGFTATGLTTGTATITPAVGSTLPVSVAQTFTVTVSAGATGTLTLAPTFTAQTPLSITLETHSKGTFTPIGAVYSGESFTFPTVTPNDPTCATFLGWVEGTTFDGDGETTNPSDVTSLPEYHAASTSSGTLTTNKTYTAVFGEKDTQETTAYVKVAAAPADWSGDYLIVRESIERAFDGSLETLDAANNYIDITIVDGKIAKGSLAANQFTIAKVGATDNYTIKSASGKYIGRTSTSNGLEASTSTEYTNTLAYSSDHVVITSSGGPTLQMNGGTRFRYYASSQQELQLYKLGTAQMITYTYTTNPACTPRYRVTVNSAVGGSPSADKTYEHADETITITANPAAGYSFTSWTITKTTGGDNVTSTLLTGDNPTTANTTFTMPAYDITIAATYAKKMVSTLEVKDGATVISTTTGPVSGTVNISTGANKTLDVVITPSDAYDHSWTASVTDGGTYASITNVTDDGFRVNGLAQGDATITVNAPNDGSAKSVTLTVHVTDIMPEEIILKREGSDTPIETLVMYYDASESKGQYVKVNVGYSPANPTNKAFTFSSALTGKVGSHSHAPASGYEVLVANGVTSDAVNCTFTSSADGSVTKVLAVTVLPILTDRFVDYIHGNATQTVSARLSVDRYTMITDINTPSLSDASDADPTSEDCETAHYHLIGWLPQATAEALMAAGTPITEATEGLVRAGVQVEATGQTWCAIWAKEAE